MRAAIYARFSSGLQDNRSITDQVAMAQKYGRTSAGADHGKLGPAVAQPG
jgi:hypothetical protein